MNPQCNQHHADPNYYICCHPLPAWGTADASCTTGSTTTAQDGDPCTEGEANCVCDDGSSSATKRSIVGDVWFEWIDGVEYEVWEEMIEGEWNEEKEDWEMSRQRGEGEASAWEY